jgi:predicted dehydrogenase
MSKLNRRHFLFGSLAVPIFGQSAQEEIGTAFIGTGNRGSYLLKQAMSQPGVKIVALCDIKPDRLDKAATTAGRDKPATYTDYTRMLERDDVKAVFIATPCDLHVEMAIAALKAGKHVYCEKPAGITPESIRELVKAVRQAKTIFQIGQQMRASRRLRQTIQRIHDGAVGKVIMVKAARHAGDDLAHNGPSADWFFNAARSGDVIVEMAVHNLDECNWVINSYPERAAGFGGTLLWKNDPPGRTNMDGYTLSYEYQNGVKLSFIQMFFHPDSMPGGGQYAYVYTTEGAVDLNSSMFYPRGRGGSPKPLVEKSAERENPDAHVADFYECIRTGQKPFADIAVAASAALTSIMGREAIYQKRVVTWQEMGVSL